MKKLYYWAIAKSEIKVFEKITELFIFYFTYIFITYIITFNTVLVDEIITKLLGYNSILYTRNTIDSSIQSLGLSKALIVLVFFAPVFEEISFRLIIKPSRVTVALSVSAMVLIFIEPFYFIKNVKFNFLNMFIVALIFISTFLCFKYYWVEFLRKNQYYLYITTSLFFGLIHLLNFEIPKNELLVIFPIYCLPQVLLGFMLGAIRIRNGFIWAVLLHMLVNSTIIWGVIF